VGTGFLIRVWKLRSGARIPVPVAGGMDAEGDAMRERIRRETEY
jgi:cytochrome c-type biogenesis protein CcmH